MIELTNVSLPLDAGLPEGGPLIAHACARKLGIPVSQVQSYRLLKRSVDARKKSDVHFVATILVDDGSDGGSAGGKAAFDDKPTALAGSEISAGKLISRIPDSEPRPVVCGFGPAGMFAALTLARAGARPLVVERGASVGERARSVERFLATGELDPECNIQFGEGGAGTFSDGKLNTNTHNPLTRSVLTELHAAGAPEEILWQAKPHVGTDLLGGIVVNIRKEIERLGGEVLFGTRMTDIVIEGGQLTRVMLEDGPRQMEVPTSRLVLALGHSARDTFAMLSNRGLPMERKPFSMGVRIEHLQHDVNVAQYGKAAGHPALGAADYKLSCHLPDGRGVYTFCMCPGGTVVAAATEEGMVVTNGMSTFARDGANANSAFLVNVLPEDMGDGGPLAGVELQRTWERAAYQAGGGQFHAPAQLMGDFLSGRPTTDPGALRIAPTYQRGVTWTSLDGCLPGFIVSSLKQAAPIFGRKLRGFDAPDAVLTGIESRSSSPVRILRDTETFQSAVRGIYPCGEGAGYAGGIMSSAVDGIRVARAVLDA